MLGFLQIFESQNFDQFPELSALGQGKMQDDQLLYIFKENAICPKMEFADTLPNECPPASARELDSSLCVFRIVSTDPPTADDFTSHWYLFPEKRGPRWPECKARSVSVYETSEFCEENLKLPRFRGKKVCKVNLTPGSGMLDKNGRGGHISWWVARGYDPLRHCEVLA